MFTQQGPFHTTSSKYSLVLHYLKHCSVADNLFKADMDRIMFQP